MARLKNVSGSPLLLFARPGQAESFEVADGAIIDVPGEVDEKASEAAGDAYVINGRAWPAANWELTKAGERSRSGSRKTDGEE